MNCEGVSQIRFIIIVSKNIGVRPYRVAMDIRHRKDLRQLWEIRNCHSAVAVIPTTTTSAPE